MPRPGIRYEDVEHAAEVLTKSQTTPTHERIRQALGGGSFSTIGRHLQTWRQCQAEQGQVAEDAVPPDSLIDAVKGVWQGMRGAAEARVSDVETDAKARILQAQTAAQSELAAAAQAHADVLAHHQERHQMMAGKAQADAALAQQQEAMLRAQLAEQAQALAALHSQHRQALVDAAAASGRLASVTAQYETLKEDVHQQLLAAQAQIDADRQQQLAHTAEVTKSHQTALAALAAERDRSEAVCARRVASANAQLQAAQTSHQNQLQDLQQDLQRAQGTVIQLQARLEAQMCAAEASLTSAQEQLRNAQSQAQLHHAEAQKQHMELSALRGETQARLRLVDEVREAFATLTHEQRTQRRADA